MNSLRNRGIRSFTDLHVALIRSTHWKLGARLGSQVLCVLTTTGRKSGAERRNPLARFPHGDGLVEGYQVKTSRNIPVVILEPRA